MTRTLLLAIALLVVACGPSPDQELEKARSALASGKHADAAAAASAGLAAGAEGATAWRLELVALEAEARGGKTTDALARLDRLASSHPDQVKGALYAQTAGQVKEAGDGAGAVQVLHAGAQRFPEDADIARAIEQAKATGGEDQLKALKSLGYVQ